MAALMVVNKKNIIPEKSMSVELRPLTFNDRRQVQKWLSDPYILRLTFVVPGPGCAPSLPFNEQSAEQYMGILINDISRITFAINVDGEHIGNIGIKEYSQSSNVGECFIEIGEERYRGKGVGTAAMSILLDYAFFTLGLAEIRLEVLEFNAAAIRVYQRLGFVRTHRSGWHYDSDGQYWQVWAMCLTVDRWTGIKKRLSFAGDLEILPLSKI